MPRGRQSLSDYARSSGHYGSYKRRRELKEGTREGRTCPCIGIPNFIKKKSCQDIFKLSAVLTMILCLVILVIVMACSGLSSSSESGLPFPLPGEPRPVPNPKFPPPPEHTPSAPGKAGGPLSSLSPVDDLGFYGAKRIGSALPVQRLWGEMTTPYPTHEFFQNIVLGKGSNPENVITVLPYIVSIQHNLMSAIYPFVVTSSAQVQQIFDSVMGLISLGADGMEAPRLLRSDKLSVTVGWEADGGSATMVSTLVQGDPYFSMQYSNAQVKVTSPQGVISLKIDGQKVELPCDGKNIYTANKIEIGLLQHDALWFGYAFPEINVKCNDGGKLSLTSSDPYTGVIRVALAHNCTRGSGLHCPERLEGVHKTLPPPEGWFELLDKYSSSRIIGGHPEYNEKVDIYTSKQASVQLMYDTEDINTGAQATGALVLLLPHHRNALQHGVEVSGSTIHRTMFGSMTPYVVKPSLDMYFELPSMMWNSPNPVATQYDHQLRKAVKEDVDKFVMPQNYQIGAGDPYNAGKLLSRMARIVLIADELELYDQRDKMVQDLANYTSLWVVGKTFNQLVYDTNWGGIVSCGCMYDDCGGKCKAHCDNGGPPVCPSLAEGSFAAGMDFGNGYYNDHHFHYGYIVYAAAVVAKFLPQWAEDYKEFVLLLIRDVANPSPDDTSFPQFRHMDFYAGHSWAGGIFQPYLNGRNQESVSEATNCWYAIALYGDAVKDDRIRSIGLTLLSMEVHAAHNYWQLWRKGSPTLPDGFAKNGVSGILWQNLIQYQTWFGSTTWELNGIQMLPFTPISEFLLRPKWVGQQIGDFQESCSGQCVEDGWISLVCMAQAVVDRNGAWMCADKLDNDVYSPYTAEGNGNSRSNLLYWIATRPVL